MIGNLVGSSNSNINNSYYLLNQYDGVGIQNDEYVTGSGENNSIGFSLVQMKEYKNFEKFDFENVWSSVKNNGFVFPQLKNNTLEGEYISDIKITNTDYDILLDNKTYQLSYDVVPLDSIEKVQFKVVDIDGKATIDNNGKLELLKEGKIKVIVYSEKLNIIYAEKEFNIRELKDVNNLNFEEIKPFIYNGNEIKPEVKIKDNEYILVEDVDYTLSYDNNINIGEATVKIEGIGYYKGTIEKTFKILTNQICESGYYKYKFLTDGTIEIVAYTGKERDVNIPSKIDGFDVTSIGKKAFYNTWIHTLVMPSTIINIDEKAFAQCNTLAEIRFNEGLKNIGESAFSSCYSLRNIELPNSVVSIGKSVFSYCTYLESVKLSNNIINIPYGAFDGCDYLVFVEVPDSVIKIEKNAFSSGDLKHIIIPSSTNQVDEEAFGDVTHQLTIYGQQNSYIQEYANLNQINFKDINNFNKEETYRTYEVKKRREGYVVIDTDSFSDIYCDAYWEIEDTSIAKITESKNATEKNGLSYSVFISSYIEGVSVGTTKLFLKAKDGTIIKTYKLDVQSIITQLSNNFSVWGITYATTYTGKEITHNVKMESSSHDKMIKDVDYTVTYLNNVNVGTATIIIKGIDTYAGEITKTFDIAPRNIGDIDIKLDNNAKEYTGEEIYTDIIAKFGDIELKHNVDYKLEYRHNINAGIAKVFITGIGNYTATRECSFEIKKANIKNNSTNYEGIYDGKEHSINVKVDIPNYDIKYSVNNNEYNSNTLPSFKEVGDYTVNYKITSPNYNDLIGSNKVRIYGVKKLDSTLEIRNNMLIVKNYKNNFTDLCNRIQLHANSKSYLHLNQNKNVINDLLVRTGEYIQLVINNSTKLEYKVSVLADVNGDGKISALDYVKIKNHIMKTNLISSDVYLTAADVNDDGKISALDYVRIKNYIMNGGV